MREDKINIFVKNNTEHEASRNSTKIGKFIETPKLNERIRFHRHIDGMESKLFTLLIPTLFCTILH